MKMKNLVREKIAANGYVLGAFIASSSAMNCEILGLNGLDFVMIDCEHAETNSETIVNMCRACELYNMAPLVRVYDPEDGAMMSRMLDVGVHGVMAPLVNSKENAEKVVEYTKYPPYGKRGANGGRGPRWGSYEDYVHVCNDNILTIIQCESMQAVADIDNIASVPGVDVIFIGTGDLSLDMGIKFSADSAADHHTEDPRLAEAIQKVLRTCQKHGVIPGIVTASAQDAANRIRQGFQFVTCMNDLGFFHSRSLQHINEVRRLVSNT